MLGCQATNVYFFTTCRCRGSRSAPPNVPPQARKSGRCVGNLPADSAGATTQKVA